MTHKTGKKTNVDHSDCFIYQCDLSDIYVCNAYQKSQKSLHIFVRFTRYNQTWAWGDWSPPPKKMLLTPTYAYV